MRHALTFLHGFLDYPRGVTVQLRDYAGYRAYRAGRSLAGRLRTGSRTAPAHLLGPAHFGDRESLILASTTAPRSEAPVAEDVATARPAASRPAEVPELVGAA